MKIAILSDIHANLPALEAALESLAIEKPDAIYCLGDLVGYHIWPNEVIREIRQRSIATISGNHDAKAMHLLADQTDEGNPHFDYQIIGKDEKTYLASLPAHIRLEFQLNSQHLNILMVHGSPSSNKEYLLEDKDEDSFIKIFSETDSQILLFGHSHKPYHRILVNKNNTIPSYLHAINAGSVGKPKDGDPRGCYVIITLTDKSSILDKDSIQVKFIRFDYDIEKAAKALENSPLPNEYAERLRKAI
jgi:putative phosphoesterase